MNIAIDAYEALAPARVGVGRFARDLLAALYRRQAEIAEASGRDNYFLFSPFADHAGLPGKASWWHYRYVPTKAAWTFFSLPLALRQTVPAPAVVFTPTHYIPRFTAIPRVVAVMDLSYLHFPDMFRLRDLYKLLFWTSYSIRNARKVIAISQFTRRAIIETYGVEAEKVEVVYPGLSGNFEVHGMPKNDFHARLGISENYVLSVGTLQPRKNYERLIAAFAVFLKENRQRFRDLTLVIAGKPGWMYEKILAAPGRHGIGDRVKFLNFVADSDLASLYRQALCFALPSLYEGFGLPVLEAMAYGCPVVVSKTSSLPEIAGKAAVYVDPENVDSIAKGLLAAVRERNLMQGRYRVKHGYERVKQFTWEKAAVQTVGILKKAAGEAGK